jgi:hypothetical protein|nr:MAG TPA: transcriptional repressor [Caudoviricetes sp.]
MARSKAGFKNITVTVTEKTANDLEELHWTLRREVPEILTEAVTKFVEDAKASTGA